MDPVKGKVSIVLPTYNGAKFLRGALESCLKQTHRDLELIVVDDCSTDATPEIVRSFADPRVRYMRNAVNQRLPRSLNVGFRQAGGDYLTWTSDDNEYEPTAIQRMLECLRDAPGVDFVYADYWALDERTGKKELTRFPDRLDLSKKNEVGACFLYTRRVYEKVGEYNPHLEMVEDYDYWVRVWKNFKTVHCGEPLYLYRYHAQSLTTTRAQSQDLFDVILKTRNGFLPLTRLGWTGAYFFHNVRVSEKSGEEKRMIIAQTWERVRGISLPFYVLFSCLVFVYSFRIRKK